MKTTQKVIVYVSWFLQDIFREYIDGLVQERRNLSALAMELRLSFTNPSIYVRI